MYQLFVQKDLDLVEINPLGISRTGEVMALDGKIAANDNALGRHSELATLVSTLTDGNPDPLMPTDQLTELNWTDGEGNIGILCNGTCLAAATLDLVYQANGKPASCLIVGRDTSWDVQLASSAVQQLQDALEQITEADDIKVVLVNILSSTTASEEVADVIANYLLTKIEEKPVLSVADRVERPTGVISRSHRERNGTRAGSRRSASVTQLPQFVIRVAGGKLNSAKERLAAIPVHWMDDLDEAVSTAISLAKSAVKQS
jgi:succinyl-CoA synthetase beta subunit